MLAGKPGIMDQMVGIERQSDSGIWSPPPRLWLFLAVQQEQVSHLQSWGTLPALILGYKGLE